jgi:hypothetical protein
MEDSRVFSRIPVAFPVRFLDSIDNNDGTGETVDISANGIGFFTEAAVRKSMPLELWLHIPDQHEPCYMRGNVVWSQAQEGKKRVGVQLEHAKLMDLARALWIKKRII